jgi:hypothetical protein
MQRIRRFGLCEAGGTGVTPAGWSPTSLGIALGGARESVSQLPTSLLIYRKSAHKGN